MAAHFTCPACGYTGLDAAPRSPGGGPSYDICSSCGFEFGVTDNDQRHTYESWRARWIALGMPWDSDGIEPPPPGWDPRKQLSDLLDGP